MAGKDTPDVTFGPWPKGMNNRASEGDVPTGDDGAQLRDALNLDIDSEGRVRRRLGTTQVLAGIDIRSLFSTSNGLLFVHGADLKLRVNSTDTVLRSDMTPIKRTSYEKIGTVGTYYSDGVIQGRLLSDGTHLTHWNVNRPTAAPTLSAGVGGVLDPGRYRVKITFIGANGEESPPSAEMAINITTGQHISIDAFPTTVDSFVEKMVAYVTRPNDDTFYATGTYLIGTPNATIFSINSALSPLATALLEVFPPVDLLTYFAGRMWGAIGNILWYSEPLRYGLLTPRHCYFLFPAEISVIAACENGLYVVSDKTYWLGGTKPADMQRAVVNDRTAAKYSATRIANTQRVVWFSPYGYMLGGPGGNVAAMSEERIAAPSYKEGAVLFREQNGIRQVVGNFKADVESPLQMSDFADMEIVRRGA